MEEKDIKTVKTTRGELRYYRDWGNYDGGIVMLNAQTIGRYKEIKNQHPDSDSYGVWWAFSDEQFARGRQHAIKIGKLNPDDKICHGGAGLYGTSEAIKAFYAAYHKRDELIPKECDPQEVYFYEYNNHECMIAWDGDKDAYDLIVGYWGEEVAKTIERL